MKIYKLFSKKVLILAPFLLTACVPRGDLYVSETPGYYYDEYPYYEYPYYGYPYYAGPSYVYRFRFKEYHRRHGYDHGYRQGYHHGYRHGSHMRAGRGGGKK